MCSRWPAPRSACSKRAAITTPPSRATCSSGTTTLRIAPPAPRRSPSAITTPRWWAAGRCPASPTPPRPGSEFMWYRARMLGGRTNHYGRISLRMGPYDFKPYSRDGKGFDWPITYDDLAPYYDKAEELIGVFGTQEGLENTPDGQVPAGARAARARARHQEGLRQAQDSLHPVAPGDSHQAAQRAAGLPLLRRVRARLRRQRELRLARRPHRARAEDRQPGTPHRRHGAAR